MGRIRVEMRKYTDVEHAGIKSKINMLVAVKWLYPTGETVPATNGYQDYQAKVYRDAQGRRWIQRETIDFHGNIYYTGPGNDHMKPYHHEPYDAYFGVLAEGRP